ncbi:putative phage abortive infection protein [Pseudomonas sp. OHS18]|uniref:putative phage abortive infection protein n=1 Tax=Pseudomonas sp. OHS18 TaxID=3399679 RepID=UPI003A87D825
MIKIQKIYSGHQNRLSHYFRNLFSAYVFIESSSLDKNEKLSLAKVLRSKLSNYEQALIVLNVISHLGQEWERSGILLKYKPIKNIPEMFFTFSKDFTLKSRFPYIDFEWESSATHSLKAHSIGWKSNRLVYVRNVKRNL